ncbi:EamA family transporter [Clostridium oryzae]|uniref:EamA-like transporter family protein n=1 Tax=Clostridium oryzae TaxID=1450648 RepID=A0A1V4IUW9_9CLOT|nr:EamA family transporter [Clostridium oryzae]OPJ63831.1 EamA-like transporter family protein [Clostridium oryzae]
MFMYVTSIIIIVLSNTMYNICTKSIPEKASPFASLFITYLTAAIITLIAFRVNKTDKGFFKSFEDLNWASVVLGFCIVGLEVGYIMAYRAGWNISMGSLVANIFLALMLIPIGIVFFREEFRIYKIVGVIFCVIGLLFLNKK